MEEDGSTFWEVVQRIDENSGPVVALGFILVFAGLTLGAIFLAAWAVSITINTSYWMTVLSLVLLKIVFR